MVLEGRFTKQMSLNLGLPVRAYVHETSETEELDTGVTRHVQSKMANGFDYMLMILWGNDGSNMVDCFGYGGMSEWPGNPDVDGWLYRSGVLVRDMPITCGDGLILLGREEEYRRTTSSLREYIENPPRGLAPIIERPDLAELMRLS